MSLEIVYQDNDIIVINKPPGIAVHPGDSVSEKTVVEYLKEKFPEIKTVGDPSTGSGQTNLRPGIIHRLDKDTSGIMVVARNQKTFEILKKQFQNRQVEKTYHAIVCGTPKKKNGSIELPVGRLVKNPIKRGAEIKQGMVKNLREAITYYKTIKTKGDYSLVELKPKTGRMHQLRVHLKAIGHPVACDQVYGGKNVCCPPGATRQLLHAQSISFNPSKGKRLFFEADPPEDMRVALQNIF